MRTAVAVLVTGLLVACAKKEPPKRQDAPRPVTVLELKETDPVRSLLLTGSVISWKDQDVSFEVSGRVLFIVEQGTNLEGRWVEDGKVQVDGDELARIDPESYEIAVARADASVQIAQERVDTARIELNRVLPANLMAAEAELERAKQEYIRSEMLFEEKAVGEIDLIRHRADQSTREANVAQVKASVEAKKSEIKTHEALVLKAKEDLRLANYDLERCELHAPFTGEVSEVYVEAGGFAMRGEPVAHLVMMSPIKVDLAVSAATAARLRRGDAVRLDIPGQKEPAFGRVYDKATTADPKTRTFRVSIITRNERLNASFPPADPRAQYPRITDTIPVLSAPIKGRDVYFTEERRGLRKDSRGVYVWAIVGFKQGDNIPDGSVLTVKKYHVTLGERRDTFQGIFLLREIKDLGDLKPGMILAMDVPPSDKEEQKVVIVKPAWMLRPGQLVPVLLSGKAPPPGLYLPMNAIRPDGETRGTVFVADDGKARAVEVRIMNKVGEHFRVEGAGLASGDLVITDYIHFLQDGEPVRITKRRGAQQ